MDRLHLKETGADDQQARREMDVAPSPGRHTLRDMSGPILVVDDDVDSLGWVVEALGLAGYETTTATNGAEALRALGNMPAPPAVILLDLAMPLMDGWD